MIDEIKTKIDDALFGFYMEADKETISYLLKDDILNVDEYNKKKKQIIFLAKAAAKKNQNEKIMHVVAKFQQAIQMKTEKPIAIFKQIIQNNPSFALYNNFENFTKEDIVEIIKDKNLIELIEQLEKDEKND